VDNRSGHWEYKSSSTNWTNFGGQLSSDAALLLTDDADTRVRFVVNTHFTAEDVRGISFRAWNQTWGEPEQSSTRTTTTARQPIA